MATVETGDRGQALITPNSFWLEVAKGDVAGHSAVHKFGRNPDIDTGGFEAIWNGGASYTGFDATGAEIVEVFSSDVADDVAGTGALTLQVYGLDANYLEQNETVILTGATPVDTVNSYLRLDRMIVRSAGSGGQNAGTLTARQKVTTAVVFAVMPIGYNQTMIAAYTIPAAKTGYITSWYAALSKKVAAFSNVRLRVRPFGEVFQVKEEVTVSSTGSSTLPRNYHIPKNDLAAKSDIYVEADSSANDNGVSAGFDLILVDD